MKKRVYMVTGVKVAYGATVKEMVRTGKIGKAVAGFDGKAAGVPFSFRPKVQGAKETMKSTYFDAETPFVFAYRLREIRYRKGVLTDKPYRDGALYAVGGQEEKADADGEESKEGIIFLELDEDDVTGEDVGLKSVEAREVEEGVGDEDEDGLCELVSPKGDEQL
jgi:hypothetical protein